MGSVDADDGFGRKGIRRKLHGKLCEPVRRGNAKDGAGAGDDDGFDEQLADDAPAAGADGTADGELMLARATTGQQKDGAVGAADDQQEHNAGEKKRQSAASILLVRHDDGLQLRDASARESARDAVSQTGARWARAPRWRRQV